MSHWAAKYIGIPYEAGARGPGKVDCWGLVRMVYQAEFFQTLPEYPGISPEKLIEASNTIRFGLERDWSETPVPVDGALVAMSQRESIHHLGIFAAVDGGKIIHTWGEQRVIADTLHRLQVKGMKVIKFYCHRHVTNY